MDRTELLTAASPTRKVELNHAGEEYTMSKRFDWSDPNTVLFSTPHGSHLYGMAHAGSDRDIFTVTASTSRTARQTISGGDDVTEMGFAIFAEYAKLGSLQSLEAMFSPMATVDAFPAFRASFYADGTRVMDRYVKKVRQFAREPKFKSRRHALRLLLNLRDLQRYGRFDPRLSERQIEMITEHATADAEPSPRYLELLRSLAPYDLGL
jgi:hypothetical protein